MNIPSFTESLALLIAASRQKPHTIDCDCRFCTWRRQQASINAGVSDREQKRKAMLESRRARRAAR